MDYSRVIYLGHKVKQPLICLSSELADGFEPHGTILLAGLHAGYMSVPAGAAGCTRGGAGRVGIRRVHTGYYPAVQIQAYLMNI